MAESKISQTRNPMMVSEWVGRVGSRDKSTEEKIEEIGSRRCLEDELERQITGPKVKGGSYEL